MIISLDGVSPEAVVERHLSHLVDDRIRARVASFNVVYRICSGRDREIVAGNRSKRIKTHISVLDDGSGRERYLNGDARYAPIAALCRAGGTR